MSRFTVLIVPLFVACTEQALTSGTEADVVDEAPANSAPGSEFRELDAFGDLETAEPQTEIRQTLRGEFGDMGRFAADLTEVETSIGPSESTITLHTLGDHGWAMLRLSLGGQLGQGRLRAGETLYLSGFSIEPEDDAIEVDGSAQGCTGPDQWNFDDDLFTDEAVIGLSQHPETGALVMDIEADFSDGSHMVASAVIQ